MEILNNKVTRHVYPDFNELMSNMSESDWSIVVCRVYLDDVQINRETILKWCKDDYYGTN